MYHTIPIYYILYRTMRLPPTVLSQWCHSCSSSPKAPVTLLPVTYPAHLIPILLIPIVVSYAVLLWLLLVLRVIVIAVLLQQLLSLLPPLPLTP